MLMQKFLNVGINSVQNRVVIKLVAQKLKVNLFVINSSIA